MKTYIKSVFLAMAFTAIMVLTGCRNNNQKGTAENEGDFTNQLTQKEIADAKLTPEMLWKFGRINDIHLSPDGKNVIYQVTRYDYKTNNNHTWIFSVSTEEGPSVNLTEGIPSCSNPRWIDNTTIAFLCKENDK